MEQGKAEKFEKHRKELEKKAFLDFTIMLLYLTGIGLFLGGYSEEFLFVLASVQPTVLVSAIFVSLIVLIWSLPILHYRERRKARSEKNPEFYMDRSLKDEPIVDILKGRGWNLIESREDRVVLETFVSPFHRLLGKKTALTLEKVEEDEDSQTYVLKTRRKKISKIENSYSEVNGKTMVKETTVSLSRVSPIFLELNMFLEPEMEEMIEDLEDGELEITDEGIDVGFSPYNL